MAASIVVIIDRSGSMSIGNPSYLSLAQTDASTFLSTVKPNDQIAVVAFETNAGMVYPANQTLVTVTGPVQKTAASNAIQALTSAGMTNMSAAVAISNALLANAAAPRGAVLLSDGDWNQGQDPRTVANNAIRLFTIALGPISSSGQATLSGLASQTGGTYNYVPDWRQLARIYYAIVGQANIAAVALNQDQSVGSFAYNQIPVTVAAGASGSSFALAWQDKSCQFTSGTPVGNQVAVSLQDPSGTVHTQPAEAGPGYCTFTVPNPAAGVWNFATWCAQTSGFDSQAGAFEYNSPIQLDLSATRTVLPQGVPIEVKATLTEEGEPISGVSVRAKITSPSTTLDEALARHAERLANIPMTATPDAATEATEVSLRRARVLSAQDPSFRVLPHEERPLSHTEEDKGVFVVRSDEANTSGGHNLEVTIRGYSPRTRSNFERVAQLSLHRQ